MAREKTNGEWRVANGAAWHVPFAIRHSLLALASLVFSISASAQVQFATIAARPALWTVHSTGATVYLFGSVHLLPANVRWHTPEIDRAMAASSTFVFEAPLDEAGKAAVADFVRRNGMLPQGTTLRSLLPKKTLGDYERALAVTNLTPALLDGERPWLASIVIDVSYLQQMRYVVADGVDQQVYAYAVAHDKSVRNFETPEQQLSLFMPKSRALEIAEFDTDLKEFQSEQASIGAMVDAWGDGDAKTVGRIVNKELDSVPGVRKILLDDRNKAWIRTLDRMLTGHGTYFVTVGTGHLVGAKGVPALLRAQRYRVDGPPTR